MIPACASDFCGVQEEGAMLGACPVCGQPMMYVQQYGQWYCQNCKQYRAPQPQAQAPTPAPAAPPAQVSQAPVRPSLWYQNFYRIRKKVLAITNQYWIEDASGTLLGYSKQKFLKLKEDIRVYTDESMAQELFQIRQQQILDVWGIFAIVDSATNTVLGYVRRKALASSFVADAWEIRDANNNLIGGISETTGRGLARKYLPGGALIPEKMTLALGGRPVAEINQQFKIIGDIWEIRCQAVPPAFDRRVFLGGVLLMGMLERARK